MKKESITVNVSFKMQMRRVLCPSPAAIKLTQVFHFLGGYAFANGRTSS
jgi:hypothetical protein